MEGDILDKLTKEQIQSFSKQLLDNPILDMAFEDLKQTALEKFQNTQARDSEGREGIYWFLKALNEVVGQLHIYLEGFGLPEEEKSLSREEQEKKDKEIEEGNKFNFA